MTNPDISAIFNIDAARKRLAELEAFERGQELEASHAKQVGAREGHVAGGQKERRSAGLTGEALVDAALPLMRAAARPIETLELLDMLASTGAVISGASPRSTAYSAMQRSDRIRRVGRGLWIPAESDGSPMHIDGPGLSADGLGETQSEKEGGEPDDEGTR